MTFIDGLDPRWDGTLPASLLFDGSGQRKRLWSGPVTHDALKKELDGMLTGLRRPTTGDPNAVEPTRSEPDEDDGQTKRRTP